MRPMTDVQAARPANRATSVVVFVQVVQGQVADAGKMWAALD